MLPFLHHSDPLQLAAASSPFCHKWYITHVATTMSFSRAPFHEIIIDCVRWPIRGHLSPTGVQTGVIMVKCEGTCFQMKLGSTRW